MKEPEIKITRAEFEKIYPAELTPRQNKVLHLLLQGYRNKEIVEQIGLQDSANATHHIRNISRKFGIPPETCPHYREALIRLMAEQRPDLVSPKVLEENLILRKIKKPGGIEPPNSPFYIERDDELKWLSLVKQPGALLRIKASRAMGKTSLAIRILEYSKKLDYRTAYLDLRNIEASKFEGDNFFKSFYDYVLQSLDFIDIKPYWNNQTLSLCCTNNFEKLLMQLDKPFVLIIDEVDRLFEYSHLYESFFPMLRAWHDHKVHESEIWENLRLVIAYSTEDYGKLDIRKSPFKNVGITLNLSDLTQEQVSKLATLHGLKPQDTALLPEFYHLVEGHPYLVRLGLYHLMNDNPGLERLLQQAPTGTGIYEDYLYDLLHTLRERPELGTVFKQILTAPAPLEMRGYETQLKQLEGMGLIRREGDFARVRCRLFQLYFHDRLNSLES